jgi:hypothetical protein
MLCIIFTAQQVTERNELNGPTVLIFITKLTPWNSIVLGKLIVVQPVKSFPSLYGTRRFISVLTRARYTMKINEAAKETMN